MPQRKKKTFDKFAPIAVVLDWILNDRVFVVVVECGRYYMLVVFYVVDEPNEN